MRFTTNTQTKQSHLNDRYYELEHQKAYIAPD